ncbi:hypothetical protein [Paludisphaera borealis]|uniref:Uncharacterized protein n=1 Tax=Paludisphaera borealis TaxID=1387353 RepID=A0A1U7CIR6_9BACT|nr:hypothetical protein [Paludisphaera borealis]APW58797.1 hypothetical protein BSF38_00201 [Paludisphaera borealis]
MGSKSPFIAAVKSAFEDERRRWWMFYFAILMVGMVVHSIYVAAVGYHPEDYVASHPWAQPLDRGLFVLTLVLTIAAVAFWVVCIWKTIHAESL